MELKFKRGELTSQMLITVIILVAGFLIVLFFISQLKFAGEVDRQICHESVIFRATLPETFVLDLSKDYVPLKCKTRDMCFTKADFISVGQKGECNELGKNFDTIKISSNPDKQEDQIKRALAQEVADCWKMMGEGKVQIFKRELLSSDQRCVRCSIIEFDESITGNKKEISGFANYLLRHRIPQREETYWQFLTRSNENTKNLFLSSGNVLENVDKVNLENQLAVVFIESDRSRIGGLIGGSGGATVGAYFGSIVPGAGTVVGAGIGAVLGGTSGAIAGDELQKSVDGFSTSQVSSVWLINYEPEKFRQLGCDSLEDI